MQKNARVLNFKYTRAWLNANDVHVLPWTARSSNLNIMKNLWWMMARHVYVHGCQFPNLVGLTEAIPAAREFTGVRNMKHPQHSIPRRILFEFEKKAVPLIND